MSTNKFNLTTKLIIVLIAGIFLAGLIIPYLLGLEYYSIISLYISIPLIVGLILFYFLRIKTEKIYSINEKTSKYINLIFYMFYILSIGSLIYSDIRSLTYYFLIGILFTLILIQILFTTNLNEHKNIILLNIILLFLNISYGITLKYPEFIGRTDLLAHSWYIDSLITSGKIDPSIFSYYANFPLWHIFISEVSIATNIGLNSYTIMFLITGLINASIIILVYYLINKLFKNELLSLLACLLLGIFPNYIINTIYSLPRGINGSLIAAVIFLLLSKEKKSYQFFAYFIGLSMILIHHASMVSIIFIYSSIILLQWIYKIDRENKIMDIKFVIVITTTTIGYWILYTDQLIPLIVNSFVFRGFNLGGAVEAAPFMSELLNYVPYSPFILFATLGILLLLRTNKDYRAPILGLVGFGVIFLAIPNPVNSLNSVIARLVLNRFMEYTSVPIILVVAYGVYSVFRKSRKIFYPLLIVIMFTTCFLAITNDFTASDNPLVKRQFYTFYLSSEEIKSTQTLLKISDGGYLMSDYVITRYFKFSNNFNRSLLLEVDSQGSIFYKGGANNLMIIRENELSGRPLRFFVTSGYKPNLSWSEGDLVYTYNDAPLWNTLTGYNRGYDNGPVVAYS